MLTLAELVSRGRAWKAPLWRVVESVSKISTLKLVDTLDEQAILEDVLERTKPALPPGCAGLDFLLSTPFRYRPYDYGSRFRRAHQSEGAFYGSESVETAIAEIAFYRFLFFDEAPLAKRPANPVEHTALRVACSAARTIDLTAPEFADNSAWVDRVNYGPCQDLADLARQGGIQAIRYRSVRDPKEGCNVALLSPEAFTEKKPNKYQTWRIFVREHLIQAVCEMPPAAIEFDKAAFRSDPRLAASSTKA
jgi:hypothetical protein